ncbi:MAG: hypothetical protein VX265_01345 [Myxococcota bacterium]|nr:hypothetical protein [Myxococcota bacterium]
MPPISREVLEATLADKDPAILSAVLTAADVAHDGPGEGSPRLAGRLTAALWWRSHSPARQLVAPQTLDGLVDRAARKLNLELGNGDVWSRLDALTTHFLSQAEPLSVQELPPEVLAKLERTVWTKVLGTSAAGSAAAARVASWKLLQVASGPTWRLLTMLPRVGPALVAARAGVGTVAAAAGPIGVVCALLTLNSVFGPTEDTALPLLLGVGLACRQPLQVVR